MGETKRPAGRPRKPAGEKKRSNLTIRVRDDLLETLAASAARNQRSLSEEAVFRLNRDFAWEASGQDIQRMHAEAAAELKPARLKAIQMAGLVLVREAGGKVTVKVSPELLLKEADGILRSGFVGAENVNKQPIEILIERAVASALAKAGIGRTEE